MKVVQFPETSGRCGSATQNLQQVLSVSQAVAATCVAARSVKNDREVWGFERGRRGSRRDVPTVQ